MKLPKKVVAKIIDFVCETGNLMFMPRAHQRHLLETFDSIASHSHHTSIIAYCLSRMEGLSHEESIKAMTMATLHDLAEIRTIDLDFVAKHYAKTDEDLANQHQLGKLPFGEDLLKVIKEYDERKTLISKCAKDADILDQMYQEWMLSHMGNKMAERWFTGDYKFRVPFFLTKSAKKLALELKQSYPHRWWFEDLVYKNGPKSEFLLGKKKI